jgi:hypothetical protein
MKKLYKIGATIAVLLLAAYGVLTLTIGILLPPVPEATLVEAVAAPHEILLEQFGYEKPRQAGRYEVAGALPSCFAESPQDVINRNNISASCDDVPLTRNSIPVDECNPVIAHYWRDRLLLLPPTLFAIYAVAANDAGESSLKAIAEAKRLPRATFVERYGLNPTDTGFLDASRQDMAFANCNGYSLIGITSHY